MKKLTTLLSLAFSMMSFVSCGLIDMDDIPKTVVDMHLERDTVYAMVGDTLTLKPVFNPDTVNITDIYWTTQNDTILHFDDNKFIAMNEGWSTVSAISVSHQVMDTCNVCVLSKWSLDEVPVYPYETVFYADVKVDGEEFNPNEMAIGAFINDQLKGVGIMKEASGIKYMQIRVGSEMFDESGEIEQIIEFYLYDRKAHTYRLFPNEIEFDGETHGTLSKLYSLTLE